jgi:hypothetical protein
MGHIMRLDSQTIRHPQAHNVHPAHPSPSLIPRTTMFAQGPPVASPALNVWWQGTVSDYLVAALCVMIITLSLFYGMHKLVTVCRNRRSGRRSRWGNTPRGDVEASTEAVGRVIGREAERF